MSAEKEFAEKLLEINAVSLRPDDPFTWSSGIKSPIYCDNRLTLSYPALRSKIADGLTALVKREFPEAEVLAGTATAGIPHAALTADRLELPMLYVRGSSKSHGKGNQIEGELAPGAKVVIIEDLISTGKSVLQVKDALEKAHAEVLGVAAIFTYGLKKGTEQLQKANLSAYTLTDYDNLLTVAVEQSSILPEQAERLKQWKENPESSGWQKQVR
ncbi:orotate phosphoribosyltransferase [Alteribacillus sp. HJP-4]|uniref:orotate phosphoribosyltransferase n=1 Tax=Alteribacillus sp. HJP-4 TaxID=2775394 RepID=UPI0035CD1EA5